MSSQNYSPKKTTKNIFKLHSSTISMSTQKSIDNFIAKHPNYPKNKKQLRLISSLTSNKNSEKATTNSFTFEDISESMLTNSIAISTHTSSKVSKRFSKSIGKKWQMAREGNFNLRISSVKRTKSLRK